MAGTLKVEFFKGSKKTQKLPSGVLPTTSKGKDLKAFTTLLSVKENLLPFLPLHLDRLLGSASVLGLLNKKLDEHHRDFIENQLKDCELPDSTPERLKTRLVIEQQGLSIYFSIMDSAWLPETPASLSTSALCRELPEHKTSLLEPCKKAHEEALSGGQDEAILLSPEGKILETAWANLVWVDKEGAKTRKSNVLPGIIRQVLLENTGVHLSESSPTPDNLIEEELPLFMTSCNFGIRPVGSINQKRLKLNPVIFSELGKTLNDACR